MHAFRVLACSVVAFAVTAVTVVSGAGHGVWPVQNPQGTVRGHVADAATGQSIVGALVLFNPGGLAAVTDGSGDYLATLNAGTYSVTVSAPTRPTQSVFGVGVSGGATVVIDFALRLPPATGILAGQVRRAGTSDPLANAQVIVNPGNRIRNTDASGGYTFSLPAGTYSMTVSRSGFQTTVRSNIAVTNQGATSLDVPIPLLPNTGILTGRVFDEKTNAAIPNATVLVSPGLSSATTDATGEYGFFLTTGTYTVFVSAANHATISAIVAISPQTPTRNFRMAPPGVLQTLHHFAAGPEGGFPQAPLIQGTDGNFYGTTTNGGRWDAGTVFRLTPAGEHTVLYEFTNHGGNHPLAPLIQATDGNFYGTTLFGGGLDDFNAGTVFRMTPNGTVTFLHDFGFNGVFPAAGLTLGTDGNFYGTTSGDGFGSLGTVFRMTPNGAVTVLHQFTGFFADPDAPLPDGANPRGSLIQATDGDFYGTTSDGGQLNGGTVFRMNAVGTVTLLHHFGGKDDGRKPAAGLVQGSDGNFYGTTMFGGTSDLGTIFTITPAGTLTVLYSFGGNADGLSPRGGLIQSNDGHFYGVANALAPIGGTLFRITSAGTFAVLHAFNPNTDGTSPSATLIRAADGDLYGTAAVGGAGQRGTVFRMTAMGAFDVVHTFAATVDGLTPSAALLEGVDGNFYGTTRLGGAADQGTVFRMTPVGAVTVLHSFGGGADGATPNAPLIRGADGDFYGSSSSAVFKISSAGTFSVLHHGSGSFDALLQAADGNFYGTIARGGTDGEGSVFKLTPAGVFTTLHSFVSVSDGANPIGPLIEATDGNLYGTTAFDGPNGAGTVFRISPTGTFTVLHAFGFDAGNPFGGLIQATDGNFYGTLAFMVQPGTGLFGGGVFKMTPAGSVTLWGFTGGISFAGLLQAADGALYGTTAEFGGANGSGSIFKITPAGDLTTLYSFAGVDGSLPRASLILGADGRIYGTTISGGTFGLGTVFRLTSGVAVVAGAMTDSEPHARLSERRPDPGPQPSSVSSPPITTAPVSATSPTSFSAGAATPSQQQPPVPLTTVINLVTAPPPTITPTLIAIPDVAAVAASTGAGNSALARPNAPPTSTSTPPPTPTTARPIAARPIAASRTRKWELEAFGSAMSIARPSRGTAAALPIGDAFSTTTGQSSRYVSSWYLRDGASLLNGVNGAMSLGPPIMPLDGVLGASVARLDSSAGGGFRLSRALTSRLTAELTVASNPVEVRLTNRSLADIELTRASFVWAWNALASAGQFTNVAIASTTSYQKRDGRQLVTTAAVNVALKPMSKVRPYVTIGAGLASSPGSSVTANLSGDYQFQLSGGTPIHERDSVTMRFESGRSPVAVLGAGFKVSLSERLGLRVDGRALLGRNTFRTVLDSNPAINVLTPTGSGASFTSPGLQFSNDPGIGIRSSLSGPAIAGLNTFTGTGMQRQVQISTGVFWRF